MRKLSHIPATNLTDAITNTNGAPLKIQVGRGWVLAGSLKALDGLAYDKVPASPCLPSGTNYYENGLPKKAHDNGLLAKVCSHCSKLALSDECPVCGQAKITTPTRQAVPVYSASSVRRTLQGIPHPLVNYRKWLEYICGDENMIPPTARLVNDGQAWCRDCDRPLRSCPHGEGLRTPTSRELHRSGRVSV